MRISMTNIHPGLSYIEKWNLVLRYNSVFFNGKHIELEVEVEIYCPRLKSYDFIDNSIARSKGLASLRVLVVFGVSLSPLFQDGQCGKGFLILEKEVVNNISLLRRRCLRDSWLTFEISGMFSRAI